ncbi:MAG TPA: fibronectin type III domain-containing protein [Methylomirabilota bacterium]|nr:fibronectin type III domain-containing protein [Methylomirabilota bacterium]
MLKTCFARLFAGVAVAAACFLSASTQAETDPKYYAVEVSATVQASPAAITLTWVADPNASSYSIYRKAVNSTSWSLLTTVAGSATTWTDYNVAVGQAYEYRLDKPTSVGYKGNGYIYAGINAPIIESRGKVLLLVDNTFTTSLAPELARLQQDLVGDGWTVVRKDFSRNDSVTTIKSFIVSSYNADPNNTRSVFILGHLAVPYSGNYAPDGHEPDHVGAWPADVFYGDVNGTWTDSSVNVTGGHRAATHNVPGDGKYDQSSIPSDVELQVGRVDLYNMTCFANKTPSRNETDLMRQYLNKDHSFRHAKFNLERRGLVCDNFGESWGEAFASSGWRAFAPFFGAGTTTKVGWGSFFPSLSAGGYLWAYGTGGGSYYTCNGVGGSDDFAINDPKAVFTMFLGSYFGDWDNESNFLRAHLGTTSYGLTAVWAGRPHWFFHHMALGETIGYSTKLSQNNSGLYPVAVNWASRNVHAALMGDPTLRLHPVAPVTGVSAALSGSTAIITWGVSPDSDIVGYHVYKSTTAQGPFTRLTSSPVASTSFNDAASASGVTYMVRAVKLERGGSGTYYNPSQGIFATVGASSANAPAAPSSLTAAAASQTQVNLTWADNAANEAGFVVERKTGATGAYSVVATLPANTTSHTSAGLSASTTYYFRVRAYTVETYSSFTSEVAVTTPAPALGSGRATFVKKDTTTGGSWKGAYGADGAMVLNEGSTSLRYATVTGVGNSTWTWTWNSGDTRALQKVNATDRVAACWFSPSTFNIDVNITDGQVHPLAIYCLDWDTAGRSQKVEVLDRASGVVLDTQTLMNFSQGAYLVWNVSGSVRIRITTTFGNSVVSGIFLGAATATPTPTTSVAARFVAADAVTRGNWKGVYGSDGYSILRNASVAPTYGSWTSPSAFSGTWAASTTDARALLKASSGSDRLAAYWKNSSSYNHIDLDFTMKDALTHRVGVYLLDWERLGRTQKVEVFDRATGKLLDTRTIAEFQEGVHLVWDVKGNVRVRLTRVAGPDAVVSGVFFSPSTTQL